MNAISGSISSHQVTEVDLKWVQSRALAIQEVCLDHEVPTRLVVPQHSSSSVTLPTPLPVSPPNLRDDDTEAWRCFTHEMELIRVIKDGVKHLAWEAIKGGIKDFKSFTAQLIKRYAECVLKKMAENEKYATKKTKKRAEKEKSAAKKRTPIMEGEKTSEVTLIMVA